MSPKRNPIISDRQSDSAAIRSIAPRGRPGIDPEVVLSAAATLFAKAESPQSVTMDAVATEAGTGKGTLFRAFGSREGLLNALWARELADLRKRVDDGGPPLGPGATAIDRASAFLAALLMFKLKNRFLIRALELGPGVLQSEHYRWMKMTLQQFIASANPAMSANRASYAAHVLLSAIHIDLVEEMIANGHSLKSIKLAQTEHLRALITSMG